jgi:acyl dehydratase
MYRSLLGVYNNADVRWEFLGGLDWNLKFVGPVRPRDLLRTKMAIKSVRPSSKGDRGVLNSITEVFNQHDDVVMNLEVVSLLSSRPE